MSHPIEQRNTHVPSCFLWPLHGLQRTRPTQKPRSPVRWFQAGRNIYYQFLNRACMISEKDHDIKRPQTKHDGKWQHILKEMVLKFHGEFRPYHQEYGKKQYLFHTCLTNRCLTNTDSNTNANIYCKCGWGNFWSMDWIKWINQKHHHMCMRIKLFAINISCANTLPLEHLRIASETSTGLQRKLATWRQSWARGQKCKVERHKWKKINVYILDHEAYTVIY